MASLNKDVVKKVLLGNNTANELITKTFEPSKSLRRIAKIIVPNVKNKELETLESINQVLQIAYFKPYEGKFRYEIWEPKMEYISFEDKILQAWLTNIKKEQGLKHIGFIPDSALLMGSTVQNFCKRFTYLLKEISKQEMSFKEVAILSGNRFLQESEQKFFNESLFASETPIKTEFDAMNAIFVNRKNVELMIKLSAVDPLEEKTGNATLNNFKTEMNDMLEAYDSIQNKVCINQEHQTNKPTTDGTVVEYLKGNDAKNKNFVIVSSQPFNDYQLLTTLNAFTRARVLPKNIGAIGPMIKNIPSKMFGNHIAKTLYTILDILKNSDIKVAKVKENEIFA